MGLWPGPLADHCFLGADTQIPAHLLEWHHPSPDPSSPSKGTWKCTNLMHLLPWAPIMLLALPASLLWLETSRWLCFHLRNIPRLNWAWPSILCLLGSAQQRGKWTGRSTFPLVTPQSNSSMKGLDFVPPPPSPREEASHFTKLMHSYRSGPMIPANQLSWWLHERKGNTCPLRAPDLYNSECSKLFRKPHK